MRTYTIVHVIDSLRTGGAEMLVKNTINLLPEHRHVLVYLTPSDDLKASIHGDVRFECLEHTGWGSFNASVRKLRRIIEEVKPDIVHSHLFISTLVARFATPASTELVSTIHNFYSVDAFEKNRKSLWAERLTLRKRHSLIAVGQGVLDDYLQYVPFKGKRFVLLNFVPDHFFSGERKERQPGAPLRCIAVGNLRAAKNYPYLLDICAHLRDANVQVDVYGEGELRGELQQRIDAEQLPATLCGKNPNIRKLLLEYDLFILASRFEGFSVSVVEAMASRLPAFLSDIISFRETTNGFAHFFPTADSRKAAEQLRALAADDALRLRHVDAAYQHAHDRLNEAVFRQTLLDIYANVLSERPVAATR